MDGDNALVLNKMSTRVITDHAVVNTLAVTGGEPPTAAT